MAGATRSSLALAAVVSALLMGCIGEAPRHRALLSVTSEVPADSLSLIYWDDAALHESQTSVPFGMSLTTEPLVLELEHPGEVTSWQIRGFLDGVEVAHTAWHEGPVAGGSMDVVLTAVGPDSPPAPTRPAVPVLLDDSGADDQDGLTNVSGPRFEVGCQAGLAVWLGWASVDGEADGETSAPCSTGQSVELTVDPELSRDGEWRVWSWRTAPDGEGGPASEEALIVLDTEPPVAPGAPELTPNHDSGTPGDQITSHEVPSLSVDCEPGLAVHITVEPGSVATAPVTCSDLGGAVFSPNLGVGHWSVVAAQADAAGNTSGASAPLELEIRGETAVPEVLSLIGAAGDGTLSNNPSPWFLVGCEPGVHVALTVAWEPKDLDGSGVTTDLQECPPGGSRSLGFSAPVGDDGTWYAVVTAVDGAGNEAESEPFEFVLDTFLEVPTVDLRSQDDSGSSDQDHVTNSDVSSIDVTCSDETTLLLDWGGDPQTVECPSEGALSWDFGVALPEGLHTLTAEASDPAGNLETAELVVVVDRTVVVGAPDLPASEDSGTSDSDDITLETGPTIAVPCEDDDTVSLWRQNGVHEAIFAGSATCEDGLASVKSTLGTSGTYELMAQAIDRAGNLGANDTVLTVTVDSDPPSAPEQFGFETSGTQPTMVVSGCDADALLAVDFMLAGSGTGFALLEHVSPCVDGLVDWQDDGELPAGLQFTVSVRQVDLAGNESETPLTTTFNTQD